MIYNYGFHFFYPNVDASDEDFYLKYDDCCDNFMKKKPTKK